MSSLVITVVIPLLTVLALRIVPPRQALLWAWVLLVPDLDYFTWNNQIQGIPNLHRGLFHNALILITLIGLTVWAYYRVRDPNDATPLRSFLDGRWGSRWVLSTYYYFAHITLDAFAGGIVPFYPFSTWTVSFNMRILVDTSTNKPTTVANTQTQPTIPNVSPVFEWLSNEEAAIVILILISMVLGWMGWRRSGPPRVTKARAIGVTDR